MIGLGKQTNSSDYAKHPSQRFWKRKNSEKVFESWNKDEKKNETIDPKGKEYAIVWLSRCFSWFDPVNNSSIYSNDIPYSELNGAPVDVYTFVKDKDGNSKRVTLYSGNYDKNTTKDLVKSKWGNLFFCIHYVEWDHIETLQVKGLNCMTILNAIREIDLDTYKLKIKWTTKKKYKVISYEEINYEQGSKIDDADLILIKGLWGQLQEYYDKMKGQLSGNKTEENNKNEIDKAIDDLPF